MQSRAGKQARDPLQRQDNEVRYEVDENHACMKRRQEEQDSECRAAAKYFPCALKVLNCVGVHKSAPSRKACVSVDLCACRSAFILAVAMALFYWGFLLNHDQQFSGSAKSHVIHQQTSLVSSR